MEPVNNQNFPEDKNEKPPLTEAELEVVQGYTDDFRLDYSDLIKPVLDVGCGAGEFVRYLRETVNNSNAYGLEVDVNKVSKYADGVVIGNVAGIPFGDENFDTVVARDFISMFYDGKNLGYRVESADVIDEMLRVVSPGGRLMFNATTIEEEKNANSELITKDPDVDSEWLQRREAGAQKLAEHLETLSNAGYEIGISEGLTGRTIFSVTKPAL